MKECDNLNNFSGKNLDSNFEFAYSISESQLSHSELIDLLKNGNVAEKQIAALKFDKVSTKDDAHALLSNLTGCDGKIREAVAYKINKILSSDLNSRKIFVPISAKIFADSTIDINANICRYTVDNAVLLRDSADFSREYLSYILMYTNEAFDKIDKFIFRDKKYVINKQIFKLYWCLEALIFFQKFADRALLLKILEKAAEQKEYTVREKAAKIVQLSGDFNDLKAKLSKDENYYVKSVFN